MVGWRAAAQYSWAKSGVESLFADAADRRLLFADIPAARQQLDMWTTTLHARRAVPLRKEGFGGQAVSAGRQPTALGLDGAPLLRPQLHHNHAVRNPNYR
jgi:hypothetical protein